MQSQVIVHLDGSASAEAILPHALLFAQQGQSIMTLLQIVTPSGPPGVSDQMIPDNWSEGEEVWGENYLAAMVKRLQASGVTVQTRQMESTLAEQAIVSYTKQQPQVQLVALTTGGRSAADRALFGSVAAEQALRQATSLAQVCQATLVLVAVPPRPGEETIVAVGEQPIPGEMAQEALKSTDSLQEKVQLLRTTTGLRVQTATTDRDPEAFLERIIGSGPSDLLIVATREQALFGAEKFLRHRNVPVLLLA